MIRRKLLCAALTVCGASMALCVAAAPPVTIRAGKLGLVTPASLATRLNLGSGSTFVAEASVATTRGTRRTREQQVYNGVPVYGRSLVTERDASGAVLSAKGVAETELARQLPSMQPRLSAAQAQDVLQRRLAQQGATTISHPTSTLFVYPQTPGDARLVYRTSYVIDLGGRVSRPTAIVDANTGAILKQWEGLTNGRRPPDSSTPVAVAANGAGGNTHTGIYYYDGSGAGRELLQAQRSGSVCYLQNADVATYNLAGGQRVTLWSFGCGGSDPSLWTSAGDGINGAFSPINDAHHFGGVVHDMYSSWFGTPPLVLGDGSPMQLSMWVHYGSNYQNAFWDGSEMVFGDGGSSFYPLVVLDVTGHEISHGFTEQHSGLEYTAQSGGMNEAFSDMAGEAVKYFDRGQNDFLVGADIVKPASGLLSLRDMCTPSNDGGSIDSATEYYDGLDVHYSSGVYNRAYCVLAKRSGWTTRMAFEVFHDANAVYWGPQETFDSGACGVQSAAQDRGYNVADVTAAFAAVAVSCPVPL